MIQLDYNFCCHINSGGLFNFEITRRAGVGYYRLEIPDEIQTEDEALDRCDAVKRTNLNQRTVHPVENMSPGNEDFKFVTHCSPLGLILIRNL